MRTLGLHLMCLLRHAQGQDWNVRIPYQACPKPVSPGDVNSELDSSGVRGRPITGRPTHDASKVHMGPITNQPTDDTSTDRVHMGAQVITCPDTHPAQVNPPLVHISLMPPPAPQPPVSLNNLPRIGRPCSNAELFKTELICNVP